MKISLHLISRREMVRQAKSLLSKFLTYKTVQERFPEYEIGKGTYSFDLHVSDWKEGATLRIGAFCSIGPGVQIFLGGDHRVDWVTTYPFSEFWEAAKQIKGHPHTKGDVNIGNDVWIGTEALILSGVTIGDGAVIGARAVVAKDVLPYAIVVGNPARVIRKRFDENTIEKLVKVRWWDWNDAQIEKFLPMILNHDATAFLKAVENASSGTIKCP